MHQSVYRFSVIILVILLTLTKVNGQTAMPDVFLNNSIKEQMNYLEERTRIYENYRAIREDMFQKAKENVIDTLSFARDESAKLKIRTGILYESIDSLISVLETTKSNLEESKRTKDSIRVFGNEINKTVYNSLMWTIIAGLIAVLAIGFLAFKRNISVTRSTKKDLQELKDEFEDYRKTSREAREKISMDHFNEIRRLKGG